MFALGMAIERHARVRGCGRIYLAPVDVVLGAAIRSTVLPEWTSSLADVLEPF